MYFCLELCACKQIVLFFMFRWSTHWFKCDMVIPKEWSGHQVRFRWDSNCEAMVSVRTRCPLDYG